jgi:hypothetical protein
MKICKKMPEPASLDAYRSAQPEGTWDQMRDDPYHGGQPAYRDIKSTLVKAQRCLCAYCEIRMERVTRRSARRVTISESSILPQMEGRSRMLRIVRAIRCPITATPTRRPLSPEPLSTLTLDVCG